MYLQCIDVVFRETGKLVWSNAAIRVIVHLPIDCRKDWLYVPRSTNAPSQAALGNGEHCMVASGSAQHISTYF